jgi:endonuclease/exonuclease/phosphatase family metal-dependent hydrolase
MQNLQFIEDIGDGDAKVFNPNSIRIMSYNVNGFCNRKSVNMMKEIINIIMKINPDILLLVEITNNSFIDLLKISGSGLINIIFDTNGQNAIMSKFEIDYDNSETVDLGYDDVRHVSRYAIKCKFVDIDNLLVIGTHLDVFDNSGKSRIGQINKIFNTLDLSTQGVILCGDLNSLRKSDYNAEEWDYIVDIDKKRNIDTIEDVVNIIENNNFIDSFDYIGSKLKVSVWSNRRVDYVFGKNIKFLSSAVYKSTVSDHYPIYADFIID